MAKKLKMTYLRISLVAFEGIRNEYAKVPPALRPIHVQRSEIGVAFGKPTIFTIARGVWIKELSRILRALKERA